MSYWKCTRQLLLFEPTLWQMYSKKQLDCPMNACRCYSNCIPIGKSLQEVESNFMYRQGWQFNNNDNNPEHEITEITGVIELEQ